MHQLTDFYSNISEQLEELKIAGNLRILPDCGQRNGKFLKINGVDYLNFSSNDYLGLTQNPLIIQEFYNKLLSDNLENAASPGSTASRLLSGNHYLYNNLENKITKLYKLQGSLSEALVFNSGYHANLGILPAITTKKDLILSDKLNHASIIDGFKLADADFLRYRHLDYDHLENILKTKRSQYRFVFIVTESLFSMDGDLLNLQTIVDIKNKYNALLYVDEAHAFGVFGPQGLGLAAKTKLLQEVDILVATFGKALGGLGAFALINPILKNYLINKMRPLIFSTALPPVVISWLIFALDKMISMNQERAHLLELGEMLRKSFVSANLKTLGESQIVPLILGANTAALDLAQLLKNAGIIALPIRPPTVPIGTARLRFSLTSSLSKTDIELVSKIVCDNFYDK